MLGRDIREAVKDRFAKTVRKGGSCGCAGKAHRPDREFVRTASSLAGYSAEELKIIPEGANLGLGCGNPVAFAAIREGDVVLDLGSGAGIDCFLASNIVGPGGRVIGVDMTPEMVERAVENARSSGCHNVEFRLGEIENLPVESSSVDVVISNCAINLSTDKQRVFTEAYRVLKPGGKLILSDMVLLAELPAYLRDSVEAYVRCVGGASKKDDYLLAIREAGFEEVRILGESNFPAELIAEQPVLKELIDSLKMPMEEFRRIGKNVISMKVSAMKAELE